MNVGIIFGQMLVLFAMMATGYFCYKKGWISEESSGHFSKLVVNVFNPVLVVNGVLGQSAAKASNGIVWNLIFIIFYFVLLTCISYFVPLLLRVQTGQKNIYRLMTIFGNIGFMGIPVLRSIFGESAMIYVAFYILGYNIMLYTVGVHLSVKAAKEMGKAPTHTVGFFKQFFNPGVIAATLAVLLFAADISVPQPVVTFCDYMGNTTIPLSMLLIGVSMARANVKEVFTDYRIYVFVVLHMIVLPIAMIAALKGVVTAYAIDPIVFGVFIVELGMPVGSIIALMIREKGGDASCCTKGIVLSTLVSIFTIPLICMFL